MLWILFLVGGICAIVFMLSAAFELSCGSYRDWDDIRNSLKKMGICIIACLVGLCGLSGIDHFSYTEVQQTGSINLVSIADNSKISAQGSRGLFYVHVSIEENEVYSFYYQVNDNGFKRGEVEADKTIIYEKDDCTPHVVEYTTYTKNKMNSILRGIFAFGYGESSQKTYEIYIPKGTIYRGFNLDAQ